MTRFSLGAFGAFLLLSTSLAQAEEPAAPPPPDRRELWIPTDKLKDALTKHPKAVLLSREQYETLLRDAGVERQPAPSAPRTVALADAQYTARIEGKSLQVTGQLVVHVLSDEWTQLPLAFPGATVGAVRLDGEAAWLPERAAKDQTPQPAPAALLLRGRGERRLALDFSIPIKSQPGRSSVHLRLPAAPASSFEVTLPPGYRVESPRPVLVQTKPDATIVSVSLPPSEPVLDLTWRSAGGAASEAAIQSRVAALFTIDSEAVTAAGDFTFTATLGALPATFAIVVPAGARVLSVEGGEVARWNAADGRVAVELQPGERTAATVRMRYELPSLAAGTNAAQVALPLPDVEGMARIAGWFAVAADAGVTVKQIALEPGIVQTGGAEKSGGRDVIATYDFSGRPAAPRVAVERVQVAFEADVDARVELKPEAIFIERTVTLRETRGELFQAAIALPPGEELLSVRRADDTEPEWQRAAGRVLLRWDGSGSAKREHTFKLQTRIEPPNWTRPPAEGLTFSLGDAKIEGAQNVTGYIALAADPSFRLEAQASETLERRDGRVTPVRGDYAWFRRGDFTLNVKVAKRPGEVLAALTGYALPMEAALDVRAEIVFDFLHSGARSVQIKVPAAIAANFHFDGPQIAERNLAGDTWTIVFQKELTGRYALQLSAQVPITKQPDDATRFAIDVPLITPLGVARSSGVWAIEANTETEISFAAHGMNELDSLLAPKLAGYEPRHRVIGAFAWLGPTYALRLTGVRHAAAAAITTVVDSLELDSVVSTSGAERNEARFQLRTAGAQYLDVTLPAVTKILSLAVDDQLTKPVGDRPGMVRVQLPARRDASQSLAVTLLYETRQREWRGGGSYELRAPQLAKNIPILRTQWRVFLPDGFEYTGIESNLRVPEIERDLPLIPSALAAFAPPVYLAHSARVPPDFEASDGGLATPSPAAPAGVSGLFVEADGFYKTGRYDLALRRTEQILNIDPSSIAARKMQEKINKAIDDYGIGSYNETRSRTTRGVDLAWSMPARKFAAPEDTGAFDLARSNVVQKKIERIVIPRLDFHEATIREAIDFLKAKSVELDTTEPNPANRGVNIVLKLDGAGTSADARITVSLTNIPLSEALRYVTSLAGLKYKVEPYAIAIVPASVSTDTVITKEYNVRPDLIGRQPATPQTEGGAGIAARESAKDWLIANGVQFGPNASAIYVPLSGKLIVRNTQEQLDLLETIVASASASTDATQRTAGLLPMKLDLPKVGHVLTFDGLVAPQEVAFRYEDWWSRARRLWIWFVAGGLLCAWKAGPHPWWRTGWVALVLTFWPLVVSEGAMAVCNALLGGWLVALVLMRVSARLVLVPRRKEVLA